MAPSKEIMIRVRLLRATWQGEKRVEIGEEIEMPLYAAIQGIEGGLFACVYPSKSND